MTGSFKVLACCVTIGCVAIELVPLGGRAFADEHEAWTFQCMEDEDTEDKVCTTELSANYEGRDFLIYFVHNKGGKSPLVVTGGEQPFTGLTIKVDDKDAVKADICDVGMCYFEIEKSAKLLKQFRKGRKARVSIVDDTLDSILDKDISLRGFSSSYAKF